MGAKFDDRAWETATASGGTGNFTMLGPVQTGGAISFGTFLTATGDWTTYEADNGTAWETGIITRQADGTYARTVKRSTNSNNAVNFSSGALTVKCTPPAWMFDHLNMIEETVTSAATFNIGAAQALRIAASGTTGPVTSLGTSPNKMRIVRWAGATVNHNATSLILIGAANWVTVENDMSLLVSDGSGNWREVFRRYADGILRAAQFPALTGDVTTVAGALATALAAAAITGKTEDTAPDGTADFLLSYDASATALKKILLHRATAFKVGSFTRDVSIATGTQAVTAVGFKPKAILFLAGISTDRRAAWGIDDGTTHLTLYDSSPLVANSYTPQAGASIRLLTDGSNIYDGLVSTFDTDGFTISWNKSGSPTGTSTIMYLALR